MIPSVPMPLLAKPWPSGYLADGAAPHDTAPSPLPAKSPAPSREGRPGASVLLMPAEGHLCVHATLAALPARSLPV